ncbi:MAG TPA: vitamin K epoxide reductase family protein [Ktedonobacterales bacterium]|nr:vitamin K epoxide reductase family protein [Ktedonobacterales bacterium]
MRQTVARMDSPVETGETPPGWSYNPSAWRERRWLIGLAAIGFLASVYTALEQLGVVPAMWDPFFGSASSYAVTHSFISKLLPVPDGLLGVLGYACDLIFGSLGGDDRWRSKPWATLIFAIVITGLGLVSLTLTILQGAVIGHWCTVCLVSALASTLIFGLGIGEALATLQYLARIRATQGWAAAWQALWHAPTKRSHEPRVVADGAVSLRQEAV